MLVSFKNEFSIRTGKLLSYELVSDDLVYDGALGPCYNTKILGLIPVSVMEIVTNEDDCVPAIDVLVKLSTK